MQVSFPGGVLVGGRLLIIVTACIVRFTTPVRSPNLILVLVLELGKTVKEAVKNQGMLGWQYNTVGVSDAITMGGEGLCLPSLQESQLTPTRHEILASNKRNHRRQHRNCHLRSGLGTDSPFNLG